MYLLGYVSNENRLYLGDKEMSIVSFELPLAVLEYQTAVMRKDFETADQVLPTIPKEQRTRVAHFLEKQVSRHRMNGAMNNVIVGLSATSLGRDDGQ
jgi:coatomer subunit beta'